MKYLIYPLSVFIGFNVIAQSPALFIGNMNHTTYTGNWTRHANLADAQNNVSQTDTGTVPLRDFGFRYDSQTKDFYLGTFWSAKSSTGQSTPHNVLEGFMQISDSTGSTINNVGYAYNGANNETLSLQIQGANAKAIERDVNNDPIGSGFYNQYCRAGVGSDTITADNGDWLSYELNMTFTGTESTDKKTYDYTDLSGTLSILFQHTDPRHAALNGFYRIDLTATDENSWAVANSSPGLKDTNGTLTVPEPSTYALLLALGAFALVLGRKWSCRC